MTEPECDDGAIDAGLEKLDGGGVAEHVRRDVLADEGRALAGGEPDVLRDESLDGIVAEPGPPDAEEHEVGTGCAALGSPGAKHAGGRAGQRCAALLAALAVAADVSAGVEGEVVDPQPGELGKTQAGLDGEEEQRMVAATEPCGRVGRSEERVDLGRGEEGDEVTIEAFLGETIK